MTFKRSFVTLALLAIACNDSGSDTSNLPPAVGKFPAGFQWGTAIAPYQVEVGLHDTDWFQWETLCENCVKDRADDGPNFWDHYADDIALAADLGTNSLRIGIEWARVFPTRASFPASPDAAAVARYHQIIAAAKARGLRVMVTLHHF